MRIGAMRTALWRCRPRGVRGGVLTDLVDALARGLRGWRLCLEYAARTNEKLRAAVLWLGRELDPSPGVLLHPFVGDVSKREPDPTFTGDVPRSRLQSHN